MRRDKRKTTLRIGDCSNELRYLACMKGQSMGNTALSILQAIADEDFFSTLNEEEKINIRHRFIVGGEPNPRSFDSISVYSDNLDEIKKKFILYCRARGLIMYKVFELYTKKQYQKLQHL